MPIFICSKCGVMENTALSQYWTRGWLHGNLQPPPLCSQCDPDLKKWHGEFARKKMPEDHVVGPDGFVHHKDDEYLKRLLKETKE